MESRRRYRAERRHLRGLLVGKLPLVACYTRDVGELFPKDVLYFDPHGAEADASFVEPLTQGADDDLKDGCGDDGGAVLGHIVLLSAESRGSLLR
jgi:hypothetical protein